MPRKVPTIDVDDVVCRYLAGESSEKIAPTVGVGASWVQARLRERGVLRTRSEIASRPKPRTTVRAEEAAALFKSGLSSSEIAERLDVHVGTVNGYLRARGLNTQSDAMKRRLAGMSRAERLELTAGAHAAIRGSTRAHEDLVRRARSKQRTEAHATDEERAIARRLTELGLSPIAQEAVDKYNLDVGIRPVAVELFGGAWHASGRHAARMPQRVKDIADAGFNLLIAWTHKVHPLDVRAVAEDAVAYYEGSRRDPSFRRQYRVIWGDGEFIAAGSVDDDEVTLIPARIGGAYARR